MGNDGIHFITPEDGPQRTSEGAVYEGSGDSKLAKTYSKDVESLYSDINIKDGDIKRKQIFKGWALLLLAYQSTGVIYGDIGTSPLYVYSSTFSSEPSYDDLLGALSLIIWSVTLIVTIKYAFIVLAADDEGEGGTFAMYSLLARYCNIATYDPKTRNTVKMERYLSNQISRPNKGVRTFLEESAASRIILKALAVFGVSLVLADGILTPAQSVLGAIQGLKVVRPGLETHTIVGISCAILVMLFLIQPFGVGKISMVFAPIVVLWLTFNMVFGIYNLVKFDHSVLKAFSPYFAGAFLVRNKIDGWRSLGGILLAFTGVEALFADLGAFSKKAIQLSWLCLAYPCLLLAYIGQAANISSNPGAFSNPFFNTVPPGMFYPSLVLSILAAIVASQALITSSFQLLSQVMNMSYFPQIKMIYTSDKVHGQVYIPMANWLLMIGTVIVTAVYNNTTSLGQAYGVCVILVTFITTNIVALVAIIVWRHNWILVFAVWLPFVLLDATFLSAALEKVPRGAWFTLLLAAILSTVFILWRYGKENQWSAEGKGRPRLSQLVLPTPDGKTRLADAYGGGELTSINGLGIFFDKSGDLVPTVYLEFLRKFEAQQEVHVFLHLRALSKPYVSAEDKYTVQRTSHTNCYRMTIRHGYNDRVITNDLGKRVYEELRKGIEMTRNMPVYSSAVSSEPSTEIPDSPVADSAILPARRNVAHSHGLSPTDRQPAIAVNECSTERRIQILDRAYKKQVVYIVGKEQLRLLNENNNVVKRVVLGVYIWLRENSRAKIAQWRLPVEKLVEVGFVKEI
ncbi:potassium transporter [Amniculicola lignicola CBS 123094]|uniref:Potassium transporter n=1 Tax=Amniculicola lignicola CBS 123094 TaxID=1392246 RepID=A0A6A5W069_9PLEO|nr:potassium transporter [Amniculicola lignicola CBS 123094]